MVTAGRGPTTLVGVSDEPAPTLRPWIAAAADLAVLVLFVVVGRRSHHEDAGVLGFLRVWWPFAAGLVLAWLVTRLDRAPLAWGRAVAAWLLTVAVGMALRIAVEGRDFKIAFTIVTLLFVGAGMLGWRAVVRGVRERRRSSTAAGV
jgi:FtsH-binding integral membrane protein